MLLFGQEAWITMELRKNGESFGDNDGAQVWYQSLSMNALRVWRQNRSCPWFARDVNWLSRIRRWAAWESSKLDDSFYRSGLLNQRSILEVHTRRHARTRFSEASPRDEGSSGLNVDIFEIFANETHDQYEISAQFLKGSTLDPMKIQY
jgi:hypothetical protein